MKKRTFLVLPSRIPQRKDGTAVIDHKEILTGVMSKLYKGDNGKKIADLLKSETATTAEISEAILEADRIRVAALGTGQSFHDGYKKAKAEERAALEAEIKSEYGIDEEENPEEFKLKGKDLVSYILKTKVAEATGKLNGKDVSKLTAEEIKNLPGYVDVLKEHKAAIKKLQTDSEQAIEQLKNTQTQESLWSEFGGKAFDQLKTMDPILPTSAKVAQTHQSNYLASLKSEYTIRKNDDGSFSFLKDGEIVKDQHGNALIDALEVAKDRASDFFEFKQNNGGGNAGNNNQGAAGGATAKGYPDGVAKPKNFDEYAKLIKETKDLTAKKQIQEAWKAETSATAD